MCEHNYLVSLDSISDLASQETWHWEHVSISAAILIYFLIISAKLFFWRLQGPERGRWSVKMSTARPFLPSVLQDVVLRSSWILMCWTQLWRRGLMFLLIFSMLEQIHLPLTIASVLWPSALPSYIFGENIKMPILIGDLNLSICFLRW